MDKSPEDEDGKDKFFHDLLLGKAFANILQITSMQNKEILEKIVEKTDRGKVKEERLVHPGPLTAAMPGNDLAAGSTFMRTRSYTRLRDEQTGAIVRA